jgi:hypothetical protein
MRCEFKMGYVNEFELKCQYRIASTADIFPAVLKKVPHGLVERLPGSKWFDYPL